MQVTNYPGSQVNVLIDSTDTFAIGELSKDSYGSHEDCILLTFLSKAGGYHTVELAIPKTAWTKLVNAMSDVKHGEHPLS